MINQDVITNVCLGAATVIAAAYGAWQKFKIDPERRIVIEHPKPTTEPTHQECTQMERLENIDESVNAIKMDMMEMKGDAKAARVETSAISHSVDELGRKVDMILERMINR